MLAHGLRRKDSTCQRSCPTTKSADPPVRFPPWACFAQLRLLMASSATRGLPGWASVSVGFALLGEALNESLPSTLRSLVGQTGHLLVAVFPRMSGVFLL